jgi:hypothetical protein
MNIGRSLLMFGVAVVMFSVAFLAPFTMDGLASAAQQGQEQQNQSQTQQQTPPPATDSGALAEQPANPDPAPKKKKVWTNDDVVSLRTPADNYQLEQEQNAAAEAAATAKQAATRTAGKSEKQATLDTKLPDSIDETESMIKDTEDDIAGGTAILEKMRKEIESAPVAQQGEKQKQIDRLSASIESSRRNLKVLQDHLEALKHKPAPENPPAPPSPEF